MGSSCACEGCTTRIVPRVLSASHGQLPAQAPRAPRLSTGEVCLCHLSLAAGSQEQLARRATLLCFRCGCLCLTDNTIQYMPTKEGVQPTARGRGSGPRTPRPSLSCTCTSWPLAIAVGSCPPPLANGGRQRRQQTAVDSCRLCLRCESLPCDSLIDMLEFHLICLLSSTQQFHTTCLPVCSSGARRTLLSVTCLVSARCPEAARTGTPPTARRPRGSTSST